MSNSNDDEFGGFEEASPQQQPDLNSNWMCSENSASNNSGVEQKLAYMTLEQSGKASLLSSFSSSQVHSQATNRTLASNSSELPDRLSELPDWLIEHSLQTAAVKTSADTSPSSSSSSSSSPATAAAVASASAKATNAHATASGTDSTEQLPLVIGQLQDELTRTKEQLLDQQTLYLQLQALHRQELEEKTSSFNRAVSIVHKEFQSMLRQGLLQQREQCLGEFQTLLERQWRDQERRQAQEARELHARLQAAFEERIEARLVEFQEQLIKHSESEYEDIELKIKRLVETMLRDEQQAERTRARQAIDKLERELRADTEKSVNACFLGQSEAFKEQIKSGVLQEHLIHRDLINSRLDRLFRASEEKRRKTNTLFARHMSGLHFFVDNAHKQLAIMKEAHGDLLKNPDLLENYKDDASAATSFDDTSTKAAAATSTLTTAGAVSSSSPLSSSSAAGGASSLFASTLPGVSRLIGKSTTPTGDSRGENTPSYDFDDLLIDEKLLHDLA